MSACSAWKRSTVCGRRPAAASSGCGSATSRFHFRCGADFRPAALAHPGFLVSDIDGLATRLTAAGYEVTRADSVAEGRFHVRDPFGNRLEFIEAKSETG
jgi:hypothetical protein